MSISNKTMSDFVAFGEAMRESRDIDPNYPVLKELMRLMDLSREGRYYFLFVFIAHYNFASAVRYFYEPRPDYPKAPQRRGLRSVPKFEQHMRWVEANRPILADFIEHRVAAGSGPKENWDRCRRFIESVPHNGRWASYKIAEVLQKSYDLPLEAPDMGNDSSTGPVWGLEKIFQEAAPRAPSRRVAWADSRGDWLRVNYQQFTGERIGVEEIETLLCDYKALMAGRFYVGYETDEMLEHYNQAAALPGPDVSVILEARKAALPAEYLGELGGWSGIEGGRKTAYRDTGVILTRGGKDG